MSLKVYNGIKFKSNDLEEVIGKLHAIRKQAMINSAEYAKREPDAFVFAMVSDVNEAFKLNIDDFETRCECAKKVQGALSKHNRTFEDPNFLLSVVIIPWKGQLYGCRYNDYIQENEDLLSDIIEDYHYQNQTDQPDEISDEEWKERSKIWNEIFDAYDTPAEAGVVYNIVEAKDFYYALVKDVVENFRKQFTFGWKAKLKLKDDAKKEFKENGFLEHIPEISPGNIGVVNFSWLSSFPFIDVCMRTDDDLQLFKKELENFPNLFNSIEIENTYIRLENLHRDSK